MDKIICLLSSHDRKRTPYYTIPVLWLSLSESVLVLSVLSLSSLVFKIMSTYMGGILMTVASLIDILSKLPQDIDVMIEYMPRRHEYITEFAIGVRADEDKAVILGITDTFDWLRALYVRNFAEIEILVPKIFEKSGYKIYIKSKDMNNTHIL